ncbi:MAG: cytochrome c biogenesis protein CcsA [Saprospiraceae bacterium]|nr:cytochrome c biogenesis protein CcsA [Saprospiraceae bacterium]
MDQIQYVGEHPIFGLIGHALVIGAFVTALLSAFGYIWSYRHRDDAPVANQWKQLARNSYFVHAFSCLSIFILLLFMMANSYYEYFYVWSHVNDKLPMQYILAAFWEGQEGSFLLWIMWHSVIGVVMIFKTKEWESLTLPVLCMAQAFLLTMIFGIHIPFGETVTKIGSSPFVYLRDVMDAPIFAKPDYLSVIEGRGMNVLLQNYWMTIHPPTLFLGFALSTVPFAFIVGGLISGRHKEVLKAVQPWALINGAILGLGILLGAAWAYEALSFNGYWAWDPVENMSLVPWLILIAGLHTNIIANSTGRSVKSTYWFYALTFIMVLFSTFLTRSGVLGDSSAHAFTEMGLEWQLIIFFMSFLIFFVILYFKKSGSIIDIKQEESISSREFWMFIGSIVLIFASILISFTTSIPVYNKLLDFWGGLFHINLTSYHRSAPLDPIAHYNKFQLWTAIFVALLSGFAYYLRYNEKNFSVKAKAFLINMSIFLALAILFSWIATFFIQIPSWQYFLFFGAGVFTFFANLYYLIKFLRKKPRQAGSVIAHMGYGLMLIGIIGSGLNKRFISTNPFTQKGMIADEDLGRNVLLIKDAPMTMSGYEVTYHGDTIFDNNRTFNLSFVKLDKNGQKTEHFNLRPNVVYERDFSKVAASNPSTLRTLTKDIYVHIASLPPEEINAEQAKEKEDSLKFENYTVNSHDTVFARKIFIKAGDIHLDPKNKNYTPEPGDIAISVDLEVGNMKDDTLYKVQPMIVLRKELLLNYGAQINDLSTKIELHPDIFKPLFDKSNVNTHSLTLKPGEHFEIGGKKMIFKQFKMADKDPKKIIVSGVLTDETGKIIGNPSFEIIGNSSRSDKVYLADANALIAMIRINPDTETASFEYNVINGLNKNIPLKVAENSTRSDYIVLEAVEFPGINFFWLGSLMMMVGLGWSILPKLKSKVKSARAA